MKVLQEHFGCKEAYHKCILAELVFDVLSESANKTGYTGDMKEDLRKFLFEDMYGTAEEKVLDITGYWANDLEAVFIEVTGFNGQVFRELFRLLKDKEAISGVVMG